MGENAGIENGGQQTQGQPTGNVGGTGGAPQQNGGQGLGQPQQQQQPSPKPYDQYLQQIPEGLRPAVEQVFQQWDGDTTRRFQDLQGQISAYQPYQQLFDEWEPSALQQAVQIAEALGTEDGARALYQQLHQQFGNGQGQQQQQQGAPGQQQNGDPFLGTNQNDDFFADPRFQKLEQGLGQLTQMLTTQQTEAQQKAEQAKAAEDWNAAVEKHKALITGPDGEIDPTAHDMVLSVAINMTNGDLDKAFEMYAKSVGKQATALNQPGQNAPIVGGGAQNNMPSQVTDPSKWTPEQRKEAALAVMRGNRQQQG